jgi:hypothetical protein
MKCPGLFRPICLSARQLHSTQQSHAFSSRLGQSKVIKEAGGKPTGERDRGSVQATRSLVKPKIKKMVLSLSSTGGSFLLFFLLLFSMENPKMIKKVMRAAINQSITVSQVFFLLLSSVSVFLFFFSQSIDCFDASLM